jgi:hypothetical protein
MWRVAGVVARVPFRCRDVQSGGWDVNFRCRNVAPRCLNVTIPSAGVMGRTFGVHFSR